MSITCNLEEGATYTIYSDDGTHMSINGCLFMGADENSNLIFHKYNGKFKLIFTSDALCPTTNAQGFTYPSILKHTMTRGPPIRGGRKTKKSKKVKKVKKSKKTRKN
jgi:hypothetical protein